MLSTKEKLMSGAFWNILSLVCVQVSQVFISLFLARLLGPEIFGTLGLVLVFANFASSFLDFGFNSALVQQLNTSEEDYSTIFWLNIISSIVLFSTFFSLSYIIADFYNNQNLIPLVKWISVIFILGALGKVHQTKMQRDLLFKKIFITRVTSVLISGGLGIFLAINGFEIWSLVIQILSTTLIQTILSWLISDWRPMLVFNKQTIRNTSKYSLNLSGIQIFNYWVKNLDKLLVGKFLGNSQLGLYSRSYQYSFLPLNILLAIDNVTLPILAKYQKDLMNLGVMFFKIINVILFPFLMLQIYLLFIAYDFVNYLLGVEWLGMIPSFRILILATIFITFQIVNNLFKILGRTDLELKIEVLTKIPVFIAVVIGLKWGVEGVAIGFLISMIISAFFRTYYSMKLIDVSMVEYFVQIKNVLGFISLYIIINLIFYQLQTLLQISSLFSIIYFLLPIVIQILIMYLLKSSLIIELLNIKNFILKNKYS